MNFAKVNADVAKENKLDIEKKIKNIAQIKSEKELAIKNNKPFVNNFKATDTTFTPQELDMIKSKKVIVAEYPTFAGFTIKTLFDFFMVFVVLCGLAAVVLFALTPKLKKMMHGVR
jgi:POT family proton-dependent oligopeptide transporter